jgi:hypothetical protein
VATQTEAQMYHERIVDTVGRIIATLDGLSGEDVNWKPPADATNSLYVLATHMLGNLHENIVHQLGGQPLDRDRDGEFRASGASAEQLQARWEQLKSEVAATFANLAPDALDREYTRPRSGEVLTGRKLMLNTAIHAGEHAGHAEMTRDLLKAK